MDDNQVVRLPDSLTAILRETDRVGFTMGSERKVGSLLAVLAASKPGGRFLELGTGTGHGTAWILSGMDSFSRLDTVDTDASLAAVARRHLGSDSRVTFHIADGAEFIGRMQPASFDFIYADAWPGKFSHLDETLALLRPGGIYFVDDMLPQPNWPDGHAPNVDALIEVLDSRPGFAAAKLAWASGVMIVVRVSAP